MFGSLRILQHLRVTFRKKLHLQLYSTPACFARKLVELYKYSSLFAHCNSIKAIHIMEQSSNTVTYVARDLDDQANPGTNSVENLNHLPNDTARAVYSKSMPITETDTKSDFSKNCGVISFKEVPDNENPCARSTSRNVGEIFSSGDSNHGRKESRKRKPRKKSLHETFKRPKLTSDEEIFQTVPYVENGLRKVVPYDFKYNTFAKGRWIGMTLGEVYTREFRLYPIEYYERAIENKRILVNLKPAKSLSRVVRSNDLITSIGHRHECPVSSSPITVIADTDEFFVINKPCTIPLHPAGRFRHNCLLSILARDFKKTDIFSIHRLDRMTSGLTVFTKSRELAGKCHVQIKQRQIDKEYVCRVVGNFQKFSLPENHDHRIKMLGDEVIVSESLKVYDLKIGTSIVSRSDDAKDSVTTFRCLSTDGKTSIVSCKPKTGRTHQIRVHLQYLGFPITNDPMYNTDAWGDDRFKLGPISKPMDEVMTELATMKKWKTVLESFEESIREKDCEHAVASANVETNPTKPALSPALLEAAAEVEGLVPYRAECEECRHPLPDPRPDELVMYLHALKYKGPDWGFETPLPEWASSKWAEESANPI